MILVTGAAGKTGRAVLRALIARGEPVRALVHRADQVPVLASLGVRDVQVGDMRNPADMGQAFDRVQKVYHICPNVSPDEAAIGATAIAAARSAGVERFVFHSVLHPQAEAMPHHWQKLRVEEQLFESGLTFTILQPAAYMQNILSHWDTILGEGRYPIPYPGETRLSLVDLGDIAQVAAIALTEPGHEHATYELAGTPGLTQNQVAGILSQGVGRPVNAISVPIEIWEEGARRSGIEDYQIETLICMFRYYARYGLCGNPQVLSWLLQRPPRTLENFIEDTIHQQLQQEPL